MPWETAYEIAMMQVYGVKPNEPYQEWPEKECQVHLLMCELLHENPASPNTGLYKLASRKVF